MNFPFWLHGYESLFYKLEHASDVDDLNQCYAKIEGYLLALFSTETINNDKYNEMIKQSNTLFSKKYVKYFPDPSR